MTHNSLPVRPARDKWREGVSGELDGVGVGVERGWWDGGREGAREQEAREGGVEMSTVKRSPAGEVTRHDHWEVDLRDKREIVGLCPSLATHTAI